jgi:hypothetical protein
MRASLSIETISEARRHDAGDTCAEGVGRYDLAKSLRADVEVRHDCRAEGRYDHEVQDDRELQKCEQPHNELLIAGEFQPHGRLWFSNSVAIASLEICPHPKLASARLRTALPACFPQQGHRSDELREEKGGNEGAITIACSGSKRAGTTAPAL